MPQSLCENVVKITTNCIQQIHPTHGNKRPSVGPETTFDEHPETRFVLSDSEEDDSEESVKS